MTRVVAFDIDHTLLIDNKLERVALLHLLEQIVRDGGHALGSLARETALIDTLLAEQRAGACSIDDAVARFAAQRGGTDAMRYQARFRELVLDMVERFVVVALDAPRALQDLRRRGFTLAILTNGWNPLQARKAACLGFEGPVLVSADLGVQKPDPRAFHALTSSLGVEPADVWYVGDDPQVDVAGAAGAGMHAVWIDAEDVPYPPGLPPPTMRIGSLAELAAALPVTAYL